MNEGSFKIRLATIYDVDRLVELHCNTFKPEEHVPMMLGRNYVKASYRWQVLSKDAYVLVAESADKIVGLVAVCDGAFTKAMFVACLPEFSFSLAARPKLIFNKMLWKRLLKSPDMVKGAKAILDYPGFAQLTIVAIEKEYRGLGAFGDLVNAAEEYSAKRGSKAIRVGVYKRNQASRRAFVKSGWHELPQLETEDFIFYVTVFDKSLAKEFGIKLE